MPPAVVGVNEATACGDAPERGQVVFELAQAAHGRAEDFQVRVFVGAEVLGILAGVIGPLDGAQQRGDLCGDV
jgi:hypothetical protein